MENKKTKLLKLSMVLFLIANYQKAHQKRLHKKMTQGLQAMQAFNRLLRAKLNKNGQRVGQKETLKAKIRLDLRIKKTVKISN